MSIIRENGSAHVTYIHDQRYVQRDADIIETLSRKVQNLTIVSSVALIIGVLLLVVGALYLTRLLRAHRHLLWRFTKRGAARSCNAKQKLAGGRGRGGPGGGARAAAAGLQLPVASAGAAGGGRRGAGRGRGRVAAHAVAGGAQRSVSRDVATPATTPRRSAGLRHPSEDTTLEYAYDNPALAPSPSPGADASASASRL
ncbi:Uncharacterized protein GBIM_09550, partial [Gryllus bimaculatus]